MHEVGGFLRACHIYIEEACIDTEVAPIYKLADLANLYSTRLKQLGVNMESRVHSTKLKDKILSYFPDMEAHKQGGNIVLVRNRDIGCALVLIVMKCSLLGLQLL